ncbi:acylphosphatase [Vibrio sp. ZSDZ65]|uniref:Acylphosphatase n=1 Tax=Vibrio qingdaonensis TaxID=2829491 RepID=A0A9X3CJ83_9VIBR|nr:acylphosphatase [Vibrio qingdaonensis]MCW8344463.1 acylphosphatase [Vibrio qingdaonensis]
MPDICKKFIVEGHVQGVGFRYHTCHEGLKLNTTGYAKNQPDGTVEVMVCGRPTDVDALERWLMTGPRTAHVQRVVREPCEYQLYRSFKIL